MKVMEIVWSVALGTVPKGQEKRDMRNWRSEDN